MMSANRAYDPELMDEMHKLSLLCKLFCIFLFCRPKLAQQHTHCTTLLHFQLQGELFKKVPVLHDIVLQTWHDNISLLFKHLHSF